MVRVASRFLILLFTNFRRKKHSASQSNLPAAVANEFTNADFGASQQGNGNIDNHFMNNTLKGLRVRNFICLRLFLFL